VIEDWLSKYEKPERIRAFERAALLRDIGKQLIEIFGGVAVNLLAASHGKLFGPNGLHDLLNNFKAYREDPLRKKANVLSHELQKEKIATFDDDNKILPAVEYHIMRLYARTGRVSTRSDNLQMALILRRPLSPWFIKSFRGIVSEALILTSRYSKKNISDINYAEWQIGRNICIAKEPLCIRNIEPSNLPKDIRILYEERCPYVTFCRAYANQDLIKIKEPLQKYKKSFY
jgi:hypothetical protein